MTEDVKVKIDQLNKKSNITHKVDPKEGLFLAKKAEALSIYHDYKEGYAYSLFNMAVMHCSSFSIEDAHFYFIKAKGVFDELGDIKGYVNACLEILNCYFKVGNWEKALEASEELLKLSKDYQYDKIQLKTLLKCMLIYIELEDYSEALNMGSEALKLYSSIACYELEPVLFRILGDIYTNIGKFSMAIKMFKKALKIHANNKDCLGEAHCLSSLGNYFDKIGDSHVAEKSYMMSIYKSKGSTDRDEILYNSTKFFLNRGKGDVATTFAEEACSSLIKKKHVWDLKKLIKLTSEIKLSPETLNKANNLCDRYMKCEALAY